MKEAQQCYEHALGVLWYVQHADPDWRQNRKGIRDEDVTVVQAAGATAEETQQVHALIVSCLVNISAVGLQVRPRLLCSAPDKPCTVLRRCSLTPTACGGGLVLVADVRLQSRRGSVQRRAIHRSAVCQGEVQPRPCVDSIADVRRRGA
jgi:hypothetical protein